MNLYEHLISFQKVGTDTTLYFPKAEHNALPVRPGDQFRWLMPKSYTYGFNESAIRIVLIKERYRAECGDAWQENVIRYTVGGIRRQESEKYVELTLRVGDLPTADSYKQFALTRSNGQTVLGTFKGQQTTKKAYMAALAAFYESYPLTKVLCDVNGSTLRMRIWEKPGVLTLADEGLSIGLGKSTQTNTNQPQLSKAYLGEVTYPAQDRYTVTVGSSVQEGNVFTINDTQYVAQAGDTAATVLAELLGGEQYFLIDTGEVVTATATAGTRRIQNTNSLTVQAVFDSVDGGNDLYYITVTGTPQPGNLIQVSATGKTTRSYTVQEGDTNADIEDVFNIDTAFFFYEVANGVVPACSFIPNFQDVANTNTPSLLLTGLTLIASYDVDQYRVVVGSDVAAGNVYNLNGTTYTATAEDTALTVAEALGQDSVSFVLEVPAGDPATIYAQPGYTDGTDQIADVTIVDGPKLARSSQLVAEADFTCDLETGQYRLGLVYMDGETPVLQALGNYAYVSPRAEGEIIEAMDEGDVFGYEYYEKGLTQRLRLPVFVNPPRQQLQSERIVEYMGGYRPTVRKIEYVSTLVTRAGRMPLHKLLAVLLQHRQVWIGGKPYQLAGDYEESTLSQGTDLRQAKAELISLRDEKNNYNSYRTSSYLSGAYGGFCKVSLSTELAGLEMWLQSTEFVHQLSEGAILANTDSYLLTFEPKDDVSLCIYQNGTLWLIALVPKGKRARLRNYLKMQTGQHWHIKAGPAGCAVADLTITYTCEMLAEPLITYECETVALLTAYPEWTGAFASAICNCEAIATELSGGGWTPMFIGVKDGYRRVMRLDDWSGGEGDKPATGYIGPTGLVADIADATDFAGERVVEVTQNVDGDIVVNYADGTSDLLTIATPAGLYDTFPTITKAGIRALVFDPTDAGSAVQPAYFVTDMNKIFKYNALETGSDNDSTILEDSTTPTPNRWTESTIYDELYRPNR